MLDACGCLFPVDSEATLDMLSISAQFSGVSLGRHLYRHRPSSIATAELSMLGVSDHADGLCVIL